MGRNLYWIWSGAVFLFYDTPCWLVELMMDALHGRVRD